jgi:uncharacterized protein YggT (Ycf19 family)
MEIDWAKVLGLGILMPYWGAIIGFIGWSCYRWFRHELLFQQVFPRFYERYVWPVRFDRFLRGLGVFTLSLCVLFAILRFVIYLDGEPFWPWAW